MRLRQETSISNPSASWDIFCAVVDNYGDIGVCWRLARQLVAEHGLKVRLWADNLSSFKKICPEIDLGASIQYSRGVEIRSWAESNLAVMPADVVVEAFACELPQAYIDAMTKTGRKHVWINLEYLSAETWVTSHHGHASPHPKLPLTKYFFFPGFAQNTGGLIVEKDLAARRACFLANTQEQYDFWESLGLSSTARKDEIRISLFCYEKTPALSLFSAWSEATYPVMCMIPEGIATRQISDFFGQPCIGTGNLYEKGSLTVRILPFLEQDTYDKLLWGCDFNFVRGEDSFVRAQLAGRPLVWQIYPQEGGAHWPKLEAFLDIYCSDLPLSSSSAVKAFTEAWNSGEAGVLDWENLLNHRPILESHAVEWANHLIKKEDLATSLVLFCNNKLK